MYHSRGNYEAFVHPRKPKGVDGKKAYIVGSGLAGLGAACFLIRDGQMEGKNITVFDELGITGGACDGIRDPQLGFVIRGGREMEDHFECLWDLFRSIPSLEESESSVLDEFYYLNLDDHEFSPMRVIEKQGQNAGWNKTFGLSVKGATEIGKLFIASEDELADKRIRDVFTDEVLKSHFWLYWRTMFAFQEWNSAIEMKRYLQRFVHHIDRMPDVSCLKYTRYNQYESLILPMVSYLEGHGVNFELNTRITNVEFHITEERKVAEAITYVKGGSDGRIGLTSDDLVFITNGSCTESSSFGDNDTAPKLLSTDGEGGCWEMWRNIATQSEEFGRPEKFCGNIRESKWESATLTITNPEVLDLLAKLCKRAVFSGNQVTGGIVSINDSNWLISWSASRQPHFKSQPEGTAIVWVDGLLVEEEGNFIKKPMQECTGNEIAQEWLYHIGAPVERIPELSHDGLSAIPCMMPYITAFFSPRRAGDRPKIVPDASVNFAFIGQFAETERDTVFTTEYSIRTAMEAVYTLLDVERGVPEVFASCYDVRFLLKATIYLLDHRKLSELHLPLFAKFLERVTVKELKHTDVEELLEKYRLV